MPGSLMNSETGLIASVVSGMAAAIGVMWKVNESKNSRRIEELCERAETCEKDRMELNIRVARLEEHAKEPS